MMRGQTGLLRYAPKLNESGHLLLEMLLSLNCFIIIAFLVIPAMSVMHSNQEVAGKKLQEMEWRVFFNQAKKELKMCSSVEVISGKLVMKSGQDSVFYEMYGTNLRRRVNSSGHEILIQNIRSVTFAREGQTVIIHLMDLRGREYKGSIHSFVNWEGG